DASCPCRLQRSGARRDLHSFPTRRSSDLNPWPSSDWAAFVSERGFPAALLLAFALIGIGARAMRRLVGAGDADEALGAAVLLALLLAATVAGMFDAVLLLALPTLLVFAGLGALLPVAGEGDSPRASTAGSVAQVVLVV